MRRCASRAYPNDEQRRLAAILAEESYGRQIGKLLAVYERIKQKPGDNNPTFQDILAHDGAGICATR